MKRAKTVPHLRFFYMNSIVLWLRIIFKTLLCSLKFIKSSDRSILRKWAFYVLKISRVDVECRGSFPDKPFIIMANHRSYFDIFALFYCCEFHLVWFAKKELFKIPFFGRALEAANSIAVDRKNPRQSSFAILKALKLRGEDEVMVIFPQGTRKSQNVFKDGGVLIAKKKQIPIVPVKIEGSEYVLPEGSRRIKSGKICVNIFDKIDVSDYSIDEIERIMKEKIYE